MQSDKQLYKLFTVAPEALYLLLARPVPGPVSARSEVYKELETSTDLTLEPVALVEPAIIIEFQGYLDEQFIPKVMLRCALYRRQHPARRIRCQVIYLQRHFEWPAVDDDGLFRPQVHFLPDLVRQLETLFPESPLASVLRPLVVEDTRELTERAASDYDRISQTPVLTAEQRAVWLQVFHVWLMIRFQNSLEELSKMVIAGLPAVEETPWGKELKEQWTTEGRKEGLTEGLTEGRKEGLTEGLTEGRKEGLTEGLTEGRKEGQKEGRVEEITHRVQQLGKQLEALDEMFSSDELPEPAYRRLKDRTEAELNDVQAELARLQAEPKTDR